MSDWIKYSIEAIAAPVANAVVDGPFGSNLKTSDYVEQGVPVLQGNNLTNDKFVFSGIRYITQAKANELIRSAAKEGDLLVVKIGSVGYSTLIDNLQGHDYAIIPANLLKATFNNKLVNSKYVYYVLTSDTGKKALIELASNTAQPALSLRTFKRLAFKYPPLEIQNKIAKVLTTIDNAIEKTQALIHKYQQIKSGLMHDLFTRGLTADGKLRPPREQAPELYQETPIGWIPKEWKPKDLRTACDWYSGGTPSRSNQQWWEGKVPWLSPKDMKSFDLEDTEEHVARSAAILGSRLMPPGTVFIVIRGMILAHSFPVVFSGSEFCFNQDIKAVKGRDELHDRFLAYWFDANKELFLKKTTEATHGTKRFDMKDLYDIFLGVPSPEEQQRINNRLEVISSRLTEEGKYMAKIKTQLSGSSLSDRKFVL